MTVKSVSSLVLTLVLTASLGALPLVKIGFAEWKPYLGASMAEHGLLGSIVLESFQAAGYQVEWDELPVARLIKHVEAGLVDGAIGLSRTPEREIVMAFTKPFYTIDYGFLFKTGRLNYRSLEDLKKTRVGVVRGSFWEKLLNDAGIEFEAVTDQTENLRKLIADRVEVIAIPREVAYYWLDHDLKTQAQVTYDFHAYKTDSDENQMPLAISRQVDYAKLSDDFERGLATIQKNGKYQTILATIGQ